MDKVEIFYSGSLVTIRQDAMTCHGTDNTHYIVLKAEEVQILIEQFLHIPGQVMRRHYRDNEGIDVRCRARQIVDYMFTRRLDRSATVEATETVVTANVLYIGGVGVLAPGHPQHDGQDSPNCLGTYIDGSVMYMMDAPDTTVTARVQSLRTRSFGDMYSLGQYRSRDGVKIQPPADTGPTYRP